MADPIYGLQRRPGSLQQLSRFTRGWNSDMATFLLPLAFQDIYYRHYDFDEDTISSDWTVNESAAPATVFAAGTAGEYGTLIGATAATDNQTISLNYDLVGFDANRAPGMLVRLKVNTAASTYFEFGFSDAPTQPYTINWALDTPTLQSNGTTDVATVVIDTDATQKSAVLCAVGGTDTVAGKAHLSPDAPGVSPVADDTYFTALIQINSAASATAGANGATGCIDGNVALSGSVAKGLDTAVKLRPYVICGNRAAAARTFTIDYISLWCNRQ